MDRFVSLVGELLRRLGMEDVDTEPSGLVTLYVDGDLPIFLLPGDDGATLVLHAGIGAVPDDGAAAVVISLLEGSTLEMERSGFAFGMIPGNDQVILIGRCPVEGLTDDAAFALLEHFVDTASGWREIFDSLVEEAESSTSEAEDGGDEPASDPVAVRPPFEDFA